MPISFHCEHCGKEIKAPDTTAGKRGKCPHCQGVCYIPAATSDDEVYDLAPEDNEAERRRAREEAAARDLQRRLLSERREIDGPDAPPPPRETDEQVRPGDLRAMLTDYLSAMARGHLEEADRLAAVLARNKKAVLQLIDRIGADDVLSASMSDLPRPVMLGYLRQLRGRL